MRMSAPVQIVYEANANIADHEKIKGTEGNFHQTGYWWIDSNNPILVDERDEKKRNACMHALNVHDLAYNILTLRKELHTYIKIDTIVHACMHCNILSNLWSAPLSDGRRIESSKTTFRRICFLTFILPLSGCLSCVMTKSKESIESEGMIWAYG